MPRRRALFLALAAVVLGGIVILGRVALFALPVDSVGLVMPSPSSRIEYSSRHLVPILGPIDLPCDRGRALATVARLRESDPELAEIHLSSAEARLEGDLDGTFSAMTLTRVRTTRDTLRIYRTLERSSDCPPIE